MIVMIIYDAEGQILGRLSSVIAKKLIEGESVAVVNVKKAVLSGSKRSNVEHYKERVKRGDPIKGPFFPRTPDAIFRRAVRGMLPWKKASGKKAYKRMYVYRDVPDSLKGKEDTFKRNVADSSKLRTKTITLGELSAALGFKR